MLNIVCVCHNGMGTSMLLKINVNNICMENGINASVEACAHGEAAGFLMNAGLGIENPTGRDKGKIMKELMPKVKGKADGSLVNKLVGELLA